MGGRELESELTPPLTVCSTSSNERAIIPLCDWTEPSLGKTNRTDANDAAEHAIVIPPCSNAIRQPANQRIGFLLTILIL